MKVKTFGFSMDSTSEKITLVTLLDAICAVPGLEFGKRDDADDDALSDDGVAKNKRSPVLRRLYLHKGENSSYYHGLVVTIKDQKKFCMLEQQGNGFTINVENLKDANKLMEFNFFVVNANNGLGVYQHYHQSCSLMVFGGYLKSFQHKMIRESIDDAIKHATDKGHVSESEIRKIRKPFNGSLRFSLLTEKADLKAILKKYARIKTFEYELSYLDAPVEKGLPLSKYVDKKRERLTFKNNKNVVPLASAIAETVGLYGLKRGRIQVVNEFDEESFLQILDIPNNFGEQEYDDVADKLNQLNLDELHQHKIYTELVDVCKSDNFKHIFEAEINEDSS